MKMEDHFKETLRKAVANEPPVQEAWSTFERRVRRGRSIRLFTAIAATAAVVAVGVIVGPKLLRDDTGIGVATNPPTSSPSANPYAGWEPRLMGERFYSFQYPRDWAEPTEFEGVQALQPEGVEPLERGGKTFAISVRFDQGVSPASFPDSRQGWTSVQRDDAREAYRREEATDGSHVVEYRIEWRACAAGESPCRDVGGTLNIRIFGSNDSLWERHIDDAQLIVDSIRYVARPNFGPPPSTSSPSQTP
jgi:hypothetical protein